MNPDTWRHVANCAIQRACFAYQAGDIARGSREERSFYALEQLKLRAELLMIWRCSATPRLEALHGCAVAKRGSIRQ